MKLDNDADEFVLSNGKRVYAFGGVLSVDSDCDRLLHGSDGTSGYARDFTFEERYEIAAEMIGRWRHWVARAQNSGAER